MNEALTTSGYGTVVDLVENEQGAFVPIGGDDGHAEVKVVQAAMRDARSVGGYSPIDLYPSNNFCGPCKTHLGANGALIVGPLGRDLGSKYAYWPATVWS